MSIITPALPPFPGWLQNRGINRKASLTGVTIFMAYMFAGLPVQVGVLAQLNLTASESSSWFFITWMTTGLFSLVVAAFTRQPVSVNLSIPVLIFLAGAGGGFSLAEILGANLAVGLVAIALSMLRLTEAFTRLVPPQIAIAVFAGSILAFMLKTSNLAISDASVSGPVIGGYLLALIATRSHLVGVAAAALSGFAGIVLTGNAPELGGAMAMPAMGISGIDFTLSAIVALGLPILALTVGVGNIQTLALLRSQGYKGKANLYGLAAGVATVINALGGGHAAAPGGTAVALASAPAAGPHGSRFWAIVLSSIPVVAVALIAVPVITVFQDLPLSFTLSIGALALLPTFKLVTRKSFEGKDGGIAAPVKAGAITAFIVAALPLQAAGMPMAFWGLIAGVAVSTALNPDHIWKTLRARQASKTASYFG